MLKPHPIKELPSPPSFRKLLGPSFILLGLGLGSGEVILWPYLTSNFGLGIIWAAVVGITFQFFLNMEVERYTLVKGESIFVGLTRRWQWLPFWFILTTFLGFGWPGIIAASSKIFASVFSIERFDYLAIVLLILIGLILSLGPILYKTVESFQKIIIGLGIPVVVGLAFYLAREVHWIELFKGLIGQGEGYTFLPQGIPFFTFLGAMAYAGAGGNLNLAQSFYIKEKGYGMGKYSGRITSLLTGSPEEITLEGAVFEPTEKNLKIFRHWWRKVNLEHGIVFWLTGAFTIVMLSFLAFITTFGKAGNLQGIDFILSEGKAIALLSFPFLGILFLLIASLTLFGTQFTVLDSTSRIIAENLVLTNLKEPPIKKLPHYYYAVVWVQILFGIIVFLLGFSEPRTLITLGAAINGLTMFTYIILIFIVNRRDLAPALRPSLFRQGILLLMWLFFGLVALMALRQFLVG